MENQIDSKTTATVPTTKVARSSRLKGWQLGAIIGTGAALLLIVGFVILNAALDGGYTGKIEPGVSISGVYVGKMTRDEAKAAVLKQMDNFSQKPVVLSFQDQNWHPTLDQLGITINVDDSLDKAVAVGHSGDFFKDARLLKLISGPTYNLPLQIQLDEAKLDGYLKDISNRIHKVTVEPEVKLNPDGTLAVTPGQAGFDVDYDATYSAIKNSLQTAQPTDQNLLQVHTVLPVISDQEINDFKSSLQPLLAGPVTLTFQDKNWTFDPKQIAAQIRIDRNTDKNAPKHLSYTLDKSFFEKYIGGLAKDVNQDPKDAEVGFKDGQVTFTKPSQQGRVLSVGRTMDNLNQALTATDPEKRKTSLWVDTKDPELSSDHPEKLGNFDVIGEGVSSFTGSAYERSTNIKVGASYLTQTIIKPHSTFSFLDAVGEISVKRGYVKGYSIVADQTVPDVGGGICQVATTTFRAAFWAGLPIVERNPHAYRVSWYEEMGEPVGFDAAVYSPGVDLKFENPTDYYMAVVAFTSNGKLYVRVLGNKVPGQTVDMIPGDITNVTDPPPDKFEVDPTLSPGQKKQVDYAHKGLSTSITRLIKVNGEVTKKEVFYSRYAAWPNIFKVGPQPDKKPDPTATPGNGTPGATQPASPTTPAANTQPAKPSTTQPAGNNAPAPAPTPKPTTKP